MKTNIKMRVTKEQAKKIIKITNAKFSSSNVAYIFISANLNIEWADKNSTSFDEDTYSEEVDADLFIRTNGTCIETLKNNFKDYGFEADFEGNICFLNEEDNYYIGYIIENGKKILMQWDKSGLAYNSNDFNVVFCDLKPIKKEWYENPDNIGKFISINNTLGIFKSYAKENETIIYISLVDNLEYIIHISKCRPAAKEEILALLVKE